MYVNQNDRIKKDSKSSWNENNAEWLGWFGNKDGKRGVVQEQVDLITSRIAVKIANIVKLIIFSYVGIGLSEVKIAVFKQFSLLASL